MTSYHYRSPQELHLLSILARSVSRQASGCLQVSDGAHTWRLFLEQGKLAFASNSINPFGRLDRYLRRLSSHIPSLASPVRVQVRLLFENPIEDPNSLCKDYEAICWLVEQQYLTGAQAAELIETLAKDVLESLLPLQTGSHDLIEKDLLKELPRFCALDVRSLVEACQIKSTRRPLNYAKPTLSDSAFASTGATVSSGSRALGSAAQSTAQIPGPGEWFGATRWAIALGTDQDHLHHCLY